MSDLLFQNFSTVQSDQQPLPATVASATAIAPTTFLSKVTGSTEIDTISPPVTGCHMLALVSVDGAVVLGTSGNILVGYTTVQNRVIFLVYDPALAKYFIQSIA
jgi:hypothetical protein